MSPLAVLPVRLPQATALPRFGVVMLAVLALSACAPMPREASSAAAAASAPAQAPAPAAAHPPAATVATAASAPAAASATAATNRGANGAPGGLAGLTPPGPPPFATVIKDARRIDGPLTLWQKDEKVWIELMPDQFGQAFMLSPKIKSGLGEGMILGGLMGLPVNGVGGPQIVEFVRVHNQIRLQARNTDVVAKPGTPEAAAVASSYTTSLLAAMPVASAPHPDRKSVLIDAGSIFIDRDLIGMTAMFQRGLRQGYGLDRSNSLITAVRATPEATIIETQMHFTGGGGSPGLPLGLQALVGPGPITPHYLPDPRSMLIGLHFSLAPLPATPMATRRADPRIGLFNSTVLNFSDDLKLSARERYVNRWRLEKKDPAAELSDPVKPITFWVDRNVPTAYRETVRAAILEWNKAFEKIGFSNAIVVHQQADDAKTDTLDFGHASVRWMASAEPSFGAIGPSHHDPRTGPLRRRVRCRSCRGPARRSRSPSTRTSSSISTRSRRRSIPAMSW